MPDQRSQSNHCLPIAIKAAILHAIIAGGWLIFAAPPAGTLTVGHGLLILAGSVAIFVYLTYALRRERARAESLPAERETGRREIAPERDQRVRTLCHDMRTPLTAILGFTELLQEDRSLSDTARRKVDTIGSESAKLQQLFDEFLATRRASQPTAEPADAAAKPPITSGRAQARDEGPAR